MKYGQPLLGGMTERQEFFQFGYDAFLFGEGWKGQSNALP